MLLFSEKRKNIRKEKRYTETPYIHIEEDILLRMQKEHFKCKDICMGDFIDTIISLVINGVKSSDRLKLELLKCGFKVSIPLLLRILIALDKDGIISYKEL